MILFRGQHSDRPGPPPDAVATSARASQPQATCSWLFFQAYTLSSGVFFQAYTLSSVREFKPSHSYERYSVDETVNNASTVRRFCGPAFVFR